MGNQNGFVEIVTLNRHHKEVSNMELFVYGIATGMLLVIFLRWLGKMLVREIRKVSEKLELDFKSEGRDKNESQ